MRPLAVTGLGVVSPLGIGRSTWSNALAQPSDARGRAFGGSPTVVDPSSYPGMSVAEVWGFDPAEWLGARGHRNFDRLTKFLIVAAKHALEDAGLKKGGDFLRLGPERVGICSATAYGSLDAITELNRIAELEDPRYINPTRFPNTVINAAAGYVSIWEQLRGPNTTIVDGNCGALDAVLSAETHLAHGRGDAFLVGGGEVLSEPLYLAFAKLGVLAGAGRNGSGRPVRGRGEGLHLGEGAAYLCLERSTDARSREARVLAEVVGYGTAFEPPPSEALLVSASAEGVARAARGALREAGLEPQDVDAVCSAAGGLEDLDAAEREGLRDVFGADVTVAAPKRVLGESFAAAGALGMAAAVAWLDGAPVAPHVDGPEAADGVSTVLVSTVGFYGNASAVVLRRTA